MESQRNFLSPMPSWRSRHPRPGEPSPDKQWRRNKPVSHVSFAKNLSPRPSRCCTRWRSRSRSRNRRGRYPRSVPFWGFFNSVIFYLRRSRQVLVVGNTGLSRLKLWLSEISFSHPNFSLGWDPSHQISLWVGSLSLPKLFVF